MHITKKFRRSLATILLTAGFAYPACAAVCPKGIGGCTSPGRCSLFADADGNSLCDYTARSGSSITTGSDPYQSTTPSAPGNAVTSSTAPVTSAASPDPVTGTGIADLLSSSAVLAGILLFAILSGMLYFVFRRGIMGIQVKQAGPAGAFAMLIAFGISLMTACTLAPDTIPAMSCALLYAGAGTLLTAYLWHCGAMSRKIVLTVAALSTLTGFVLLAPLMPLEFAVFVSTISGASALTGAVCGIGLLVLLTIVFGRTFCGHLCPVGSLQELAHAVPGKKIDYGRTGWPEYIRLIVFATAIIATYFLVDLMEYTGLYQFFSLTLTAGFFVGLGLVLLSVFCYRPVCRIICPFGVLFSLMAQFSCFRLQRNESCIHCKKCEKACPVHAAGEHDSKRECYLCGRCTEACRVNDAIGYRK